MPTYQYQCDICGEIFELHMHIDEEREDIICPKGHSKVHRIYSSPYIEFKGKGFYKTDNCLNKECKEANEK